MQTLFAERTDWRVPWLERVLPIVVPLAETHPHRIHSLRAAQAAARGGLRLATLLSPLARQLTEAGYPTWRGDEAEQVDASAKR